MLASCFSSSIRRLASACTVVRKCVTPQQRQRLHTIKGAWTLEEDRKLSEYIEVHGAKKWKIVATKTDQEEDLILRLHKLIGNRWSLIAGRLPGRTDNEIKNYWNSHLSKKVNKRKAVTVSSLIQDSRSQKDDCVEDLGVNRNTKDDACKGYGDTENSFNVDELLDFQMKGPLICSGLANSLS
ncbi:hypothetical protein GIB67_005315 [Kingdonia uniflora]|uniref:Uncharacterized protein n=1 Tax=Kingdonia uniflora TaxID=39325 RepID=A0A7J7NJR9_9MAGN|nr:hypothetical protein GIB67_005315 [Kingdonia uniflora]